MSHDSREDRRLVSRNAHKRDVLSCDIIRNESRIDRPSTLPSNVAVAGCCNPADLLAPRAKVRELVHG